MKFVVGGCLSALALAVVGAPVSHADTAPVCTETGNSYTAGWQSDWAAYEAAEQNPADTRSRQTVDLPITIAAPFEKVWTVYSNLRNDLGRHPFMKDMINHRTCTDADSETIDFTALDNIPVGPFSYPALTQAEQRIYPAEHYYLSDSWDQPGVTTHQKITFTDNGDGTTTVNEHITFVANPLLIAFTVDNGSSSHREYQAALKRDIENGTL
ncbi:hypothetical protein [Nocardia sp. NPDC020380]|uniref:hypothetical protein n=1 Tax=Nocardia sp. NPDC020380 TaxID=3364309 RepID=UPI0037B3ED34